MSESVACLGFILLSIGVCDGTAVTLQILCFIATIIIFQHPTSQRGSRLCARAIVLHPIETGIEPSPPQLSIKCDHLTLFCSIIRASNLQ